jgi:hypothetical protein
VATWSDIPEGNLAFYLQLLLMALAACGSVTMFLFGLVLRGHLKHILALTHYREYQGRFNEWVVGKFDAGRGYFHAPPQPPA